MPGRARERAVRHERLLLQTQGAGAQYPTEQVREPSGDPAARHRLHLRPADRSRGGGHGVGHKGELRDPSQTPT